jgi:hypothetical protein
MKKLTINRQARPTVVLVGSERTPIITIDNAMVNIDDFSELALRTQFEFDQKTFYPGVRASIDDYCINDVVLALIPQLRAIYQVPDNLRSVTFNTCFSLISSQPDTLHHLQRIPHFDTPKACHFAVLLYMSDGDYGSTAIFNHIPTGYERISENRVDDYFNRANQYFEQYGQPKAEYVTKSDDHFDIVYEIPYLKNRLVIYPGNLLHSTLVQANSDIDANPATGRLTTNLFIEFVK